MTTLCGFPLPGLREEESEGGGASSLSGGRNCAQGHLGEPAYKGSPREMAGSPEEAVEGGPESICKDTQGGENLGPN